MSRKEAVWVASQSRVASLDPETLALRRTFEVPPYTGIPYPFEFIWKLDLPRPPRLIMYDGTSVLVGLGQLCRECFLGGRFNGPGDPAQTGRVDIASGKVVLVPNNPVAWPLH